MQLYRSSNHEELFPIGQPITLVPEDGYEDQPVSEEYASRIEDVVDRSVVVSMPMRQRRLVELPKNVPVSAYFNRRGARYRFRGMVGRSVEAPFPVLYINKVGAVVAEDRRAHVRVELAAEPTRISVQDGDCFRTLNPRHLLVVNLSGGGVGLVSRIPLAPGNVLRVEMDLEGGYGNLDAEVRVLRVTPVGDGTIKKWQIGACFLALAPKTQDRIAGFVLNRQRVIRRKGLL